MRRSGWAAVSSLLASPRGRLGATLVGALAAAGLVIAFSGWLEWRLVVPAAFAILISVAVGAAAGSVAGGVVGIAGALAGIVLGIRNGYADAALASAAAWPLAGALAGFGADRLRAVASERDRLGSEASALEAAGSAVRVIVAPDDTIASWPPAAERLFGPGDELVGQPLASLGTEVEELVSRARDGEDPAYGRARIESAELGEVTLSLVAAPLPSRRRNEPAGVVLAARDDTRAELLGRRLREAEVGASALVERLPFVTYRHPPGPRRSFTFVSQQVESLLGYGPDELCSDAALFERIVHPDDRDRVAMEVASAAEEGEVLRSDYRLIARTGRVVRVQDEAVLVRDGDGEPAYVQGRLVDLSERERFDAERERLLLAEREASAESVRRQRRLDVLTKAGDVLGSSSDVVSSLRRVSDLVARDFADWCVIDLVDETGAVARVAASHSEWVGDDAARERALGANPDARALAAIESGRTALVADAGGELDGREESIICAPLQARRRTLGALTLVSRGGGGAYGADDVALAQELARRAALAVEVERLHNQVAQGADAARVLTYVADGVFLVDQSGVVRLWNAAAEVMTGIAAGSALGERAADVIPGWETVKQRINVVPAGGPVQPETILIETAEGDRWLSISGVEFFGGTVYAFRDVTEVRRLDELKAEFVAIASHELRTPLAAVYGAAQTLRRHDFALDEAGRERFVTMIVEESDRLSRIVNEILLASQLDVGRVDVVSEPFDPGDLVERVVEATRTHARPGITIETAVPPNPQQVAADRERVRQVLVNLVENAIKYSPSGGRVNVGVESRDGTVRFYVEDEGLGIPTGERERVFEKFYRLDPAMTRGVGGTGLGLYICSKLVERMGGRIWVDSVEGQGSTFSVELKAADSPAPRALAAQQADR